MRRVVCVVSILMSAQQLSIFVPALVAAADTPEEVADVVKLTIHTLGKLHTPPNQRVLRLILAAFHPDKLSGKSNGPGLEFVQVKEFIDSKFGYKQNRACKLSFIRSIATAIASLLEYVELRA